MPRILRPQKGSGSKPHWCAGERSAGARASELDLRVPTVCQVESAVVLQK